MKPIKVGYSRIYNAMGCKINGRDKVQLKFKFGTIEVEANIGPNLKHLVYDFKISPQVSIETNSNDKKFIQQEYALLSPEIFPAELYTELIATHLIEVEDDLEKAFQNRDEDARNKILGIVQVNESQLIDAIDFVAGILGLRLNNLMVKTPITEQRYAYRDKSTSYAFSSDITLNWLPSYEWDITNELEFPKTILNTRYSWEKAAKILAWLLRAWSAKDPILEFVSLFIPIECVIPELQYPENEIWKNKRNSILAIIKQEKNAQNYEELAEFTKQLQPPSPSLAYRFEKWAGEEALEGWKNDVIAFKKFQRMRNLLVHTGDENLKTQITVADNDIRKLEDIAARYVSLALFGDANVYQIRKL